MLDIEKLMREGKSLDEIGKMVTDEMNAAQTKIDAEREAARITAEKKAEAKKASKRKADAREAVVAAFSTYLTLVLGEEIPEDIIRASIAELEQSIDIIKNIAITINGNELKNALGLFL